MNGLKTECAAIKAPEPTLYEMLREMQDVSAEIRSRSVTLKGVFGISNDSLSPECEPGCMISHTQMVKHMLHDACSNLREIENRVG